jgi:hypothetical protein
MGGMMYDKRGAVFGENIFKEPVKKYVSVYFLERFTIIPRRGANKTVIRPLISPIQKVPPKPILQAAKRCDTFYDI